jgi:hypothetical protein
MQKEAPFWGDPSKAKSKAWQRPRSRYLPGEKGEGELAEDFTYPPDLQRGGPVRQQGRFLYREGVLSAAKYLLAKPEDEATKAAAEARVAEVAEQLADITPELRPIAVPHEQIAKMWLETMGYQAHVELDFLRQILLREQHTYPRWSRPRQRAESGMPRGRDRDRSGRGK